MEGGFKPTTNGSPLKPIYIHICVCVYSTFTIPLKLVKTQNRSCGNKPTRPIIHIAIVYAINTETNVYIHLRIHEYIGICINM